MMDLWTLFVENIFGGFWLSLIGLAGVFLLILMMGGVSFLTILIYLSFFALSMSIGYGHPLVTIPIVIFIFSWFTFEVIGWLSRGGGQ